MINYIYKILISNIILIISYNFSYAQILGCPDPQASNYNASATQNDGSCVYPNTNYNPNFVAELDAKIEETSALVYYNGFLWTINDGGSLPYIYKIHPSNGAILDSIWVNNSTNNDWEALAIDANYLFIGDFGNNYGSRTNLNILKITLNDLQNLDSVNAEMIAFNYPEQVDFTPNLNNTAFDCEAFIAIEDSLYLFTKNWINNTTQWYALPKQTGNYAAIYRDSFNVDGLVTDATYDSITNRILLLSYKQGFLGSYTSFAHILFDYPDTNIFGGNKRKIKLGSVLDVGQTEGITWSDTSIGYISGEKIVSTTLGINKKAKLHAFDFNPYFQNNTTKIRNIRKTSSIKIYPKPSKNQLIVQLEKANNFNIINSDGKIVKENLKLIKGTNEIDISELSKGIYYLNSNNISEKFIKE